MQEEDKSKLPETTGDTTQEDRNPSQGRAGIPADTVQEQIPPVRSNVSKKGIIKKLLIILAVLLAITAAGLAVWKFVIDKKDEAKPAGNSQGQSQDGSIENESESLQPEELTQDFKSDFLRLEFKYPQSWKVTEADNVIMVKSPSFKIKDKSGNESISYFKVYVKRGANDTDGKYLGRGYAVAESQKIAYTDPAAGQRKETNLTDFGIDTPDNFAFFVVQGNFNLAQGDSLGPKFAQEPDSFLIAGGFSNDELTDGLATKIMSTDDYADNQAYLTALEIIKSLQLK